MDINLDQFGTDTWGPGRNRRESQNQPDGRTRLDWHGLAARLTAAHASRHLFFQDAQKFQAARQNAAASGSFDRGFARQLAAYAIIGDASDTGPRPDLSSLAVNPNPKADGKPPCDIASNIAGIMTTGDRGLK
jgi:hypothetical protein